MNLLKIELAGGKTCFVPGEGISGIASWNLDQPPTNVELRLFWYTKGKGREDVGIVETISWDAPLSQATQPFQFKAPEAPYSFSGKLISLIWALELIVQPQKEVSRTEIVLSPTSKEILLHESSR